MGRCSEYYGYRIEIRGSANSQRAANTAFEVSPKTCTTWSCVYCDPLEVFYEPSGHRW